MPLMLRVGLGLYVVRGTKLVIVRTTGRRWLRRSGLPPRLQDECQRCRASRRLTSKDAASTRGGSENLHGVDQGSEVSCQRVR